MSDSIFTTTLGHVMKNVGINIPQDSDASFFKDHYSKEVRKRQNGASGDKAGRVSPAKASPERASPDGVSDYVEEQKTLNKKALHMQSGFTSALTHADTAPSKQTSKPYFTS
mmetsp:Transcript_24236/g.30039  ORF Transcript_24236/g.30039 Transcript_24236/m.30039 type:complete len:112 (-) Transcript_24236:664-999(-)